MNFKRTLVLITNIAFYCFVAFIAKYLILVEFVGKIPYNPVFRITYLQNNGAAFGLLKGSYMVLSIFAILVVIGIILYVLFNKYYMTEIKIHFLSVLCAGILGNAIERCIFGHVTDFIKLNLPFFPVFNINDIMITVSAFILIVGILIKKKDDYLNDKEVEEHIRLEID